MSARRYTGTHPACARHPEGLRQTADLVRETLAEGGRWTPALLLRALQEHFDFFLLADELRAEGFDADYAARQIVDDCARAGINLQFQQHIVEWLVSTAFRVLDDINARQIITDRARTRGRA